MKDRMALTRPIVLHWREKGQDEADSLLGDRQRSIISDAAEREEQTEKEGATQKGREPKRGSRKGGNIPCPETKDWTWPTVSRFSLTPPKRRAWPGEIRAAVLCSTLGEFESS